MTPTPVVPFSPPYATTFRSASQPRRAPSQSSSSSFADEESAQSSMLRGRRQSAPAMMKGAGSLDGPPTTLRAESANGRAVCSAGPGSSPWRKLFSPRRGPSQLMLESAFPRPPGGAARGSARKAPPSKDASRAGSRRGSDASKRQQYGELIAQGTALYETEYRRRAPHDYEQVVAIYRQAVSLDAAHPAAHFALAVAYKAWRKPELGVRAACDAIERCQDYSGTWADAVEIAFSCLKELSRHELQRAQPRAWWWSGEALRLFSQHVVATNADDARAWVMRGEVLCNNFGQASWPGQLAPTPADYRLAADAFETAARLTRPSESAWRQRLLTSKNTCLRYERALPEGSARAALAAKAPVPPPLAKRQSTERGGDRQEQREEQELRVLPFSADDHTVLLTAIRE